MSEKTLKVENNLVKLRHRGYTPTALRLTPLQYRVLAFIKEKHATLQGEAGKKVPPQLLLKKDAIRIHRLTMKTLIHRGLLTKDNKPTIHAIAALEVYSV